MEANNNRSKLSLTVGQFAKNDECPSLDVRVDFNAQKAREAKERLDELGSGNVDTEYAVTVLVNVQAGSEDTVKTCLDSVLSDENYAGSLLREARRDIVAKRLGYKSTTADGMVVLSFSPPEQHQQMAVQQLQSFPGLNTIANEQSNRFQATVSLGSDFSKVSELRDEGQSLFVSLASLVSATVELSLNTELPRQLGEAFKPMLQQMQVPVDMFVGLANVFSSLDFALTFSSGEQLPEVVKKHFLKEMNDLDGVKVKKDSDKNTVRVLCENLQSKVEAVVVVPELLAVTVTVNAPKLGQYVSANHVKND